MQPRPRQVDEVALEFAERLRGAVSLLRSFKDVVRARVFDEHVSPPVVAAAVPDVREIREGPQQPDRPLAGLLVAAPDFAEQVAGDPVDVLHDLLRLAEHGVVDALERVVQPHAALIVGHLERVVDVTGPERNRDEEISVDCEPGADLPEIGLRIGRRGSRHLNSFSG